MEPPHMGEATTFLGPKPLEVHMFHVSRFFKAFHHPFHPPIEGEFPLMPLSLRFWRDAVHQYHLRRMSHSPFVGDIVIPSKNEMEENRFL